MNPITRFLHRALTWLLDIPEEINGNHRCPTYLYRWFLFRTRWFKAYIHHFVADDWSLDTHDHPKRFISIGLWGSYIEETPFEQRDSEWAKLGPVCTKYKAPWFRTFPAEHEHRLRVPSKNCWTLVLVLRGTRQWGFRYKGRFIPWESYVRGADSAIADMRRACPGEVRNAD